MYYSLLFPIDSSCFALLVKLVMEISQEIPTYLLLTVNLNMGRMPLLLVVMVRDGEADS